jgi:hypothetical protein
MRVKLPAHLYVFVATILVLGAMLTRVAATPTPQGPGGLNDADVNGGIATLYMMDPLAQSFCFGNGQPGQVIQANQVRNFCSDIDSQYHPGSVTVGLEGARVATIVDLGAPRDLAHRYGFEETTGHGQGFASLRIENGKLVVLKNYQSQSVQELKESALLFQEGKSGANAPVQQGHIYLTRITDQYHKEFERLVKFMVIAYTPDQSVTIRWQVLRSGGKL